MKSPNPNVYPIAAKLFADFEEAKKGSHDLDHSTKLIQQVVGIVAAYEHGEGDVEEVFADLNSDGDEPALMIGMDNEALRAYAAVAFDLVLAISNI